MCRIAVVVILSLIASKSFAQPAEADLRDQWMVFQNGQLTPDVNNISNVSTVYFQLNAREYVDSILKVSSSKKAYLFINGKILSSIVGVKTLPLDSIARITRANNLSVAIFQKGGISKDLRTSLSKLKEATVLEAELKPSSSFHDFVVIAGLALIVFFLIIFRSNTKLASDYFSILRMLSMREGEDNQSHARFAISSNLLFYVFGSLLLSLCLLLIFHHLPDDYILHHLFRSETFSTTIFQWLKLTIVILALLVCKGVLIVVLSTLFGMAAVARIHFFNWMRLLLILAGALSTILFIIFIWRTDESAVYVWSLTVVVALLITWTVIVFLKLNNRVEHSMFHLFSYICATEVIPLLLTIKVLFH